MEESEDCVVDHNKPSVTPQLTAAGHCITSSNIISAIPEGSNGHCSHGPSHGGGSDLGNGMFWNLQIKICLERLESFFRSL